MIISDDLIQSCISQKRNSQKQLYQLLLPYLRAVANRYLRDHSYTKDVLQESFVKVFRNIHSYDSSKAHIKHWAAKITINSCLNYNKRIIGVPNEEFITEKHEVASLKSINQWTDQDLLILFKKMPEQYFAVFNLFAIDGYSHQEISEMLKINEALCRKRLSRGKRWLKDTFLEEPEWHDHFNLLAIQKNQ